MGASSQSIPLDDPIILGKISGPFGTRGWFKVLSYTRPRASIFQYSQWLIGQTGAWHEHVLVDFREQGSLLTASLDAVRDRDAAMLLANSDIAILRSQLPPAEQREFYWADLHGMTVINRLGEDLGTVTALFETGANDVLQVQGAKKRLIPFVLQTYILDVDLGKRIIVVDWHQDD